MILLSLYFYITKQVKYNSLKFKKICKKFRLKLDKIVEKTINKQEGVK
jgi:hypothetical protein